MNGPGSSNPGSPVNWGRFDFSNNSDFTGEAHSTGYAGKLGFVYQVSPQLTIGGVYHSKTSLGDMKTGNATVSFNANVNDAVLGGTWDPFGSTGTPGTTYSAATIPVHGSISVKDFQWPATIALGMAYQADPKMMVVADWKHIGWKDVMANFKMTFTASGTQSGLAAGFANSILDATLYQNWKDQDVVELGISYKTSDALTLRGGLNLSSNPIPDQYVNPLFPAIFTNHLDMGLGYALDKDSSIDASFVYAFNSKVTTPANSATSTPAITNEVGGYEVQIMYSHRF
jgi:long-chain fatty acid transport protein